MKSNSMKRKGQTVDLTEIDDNGLFKMKKTQQIQRQLKSMPELALSCAKYFHSMSKFCFIFYQNYVNNQGDQVSRIERNKMVRKLRKERLAALAKNGPPKKPLTAYIIYFQERVPVFCQKHKNGQISELTKLIALEWKGLPSEQKEIYTKRAAQDRQRYEKQTLAFKLKRSNAKNQNPPMAEEDLEKQQDSPIELGNEEDSQDNDEQKEPSEHSNIEEEEEHQSEKNEEQNEL